MKLKRKNKKVHSKTFKHLINSKAISSLTSTEFLPKHFISSGPKHRKNHPPGTYVHTYKKVHTKAGARDLVTRKANNARMDPEKHRAPHCLRAPSSHSTLAERYIGREREWSKKNVHVCIHVLHERVRAEASYRPSPQERRRRAKRYQSTGAFSPPWIPLHSFGLKSSRGECVRM